MGTRATVKFYSEYDEEKKSPILNVYHQWDGYIEGVGHELANFLLNKKIINGISNQTMQEGYANGMGCLAAQYVAEIKTVIGSVYITSIEDEGYYNYKVYFENDKLIIEVDEFKGTPIQLLGYNEKEE
jgi:hypothetical protein